MQLTKLQRHNLVVIASQVCRRFVAFLTREHAVEQQLKTDDPINGRRMNAQMDDTLLVKEAVGCVVVFRYIDIRLMQHIAHALDRVATRCATAQESLC